MDNFLAIVPRKYHTIIVPYHTRFFLRGAGGEAAIGYFFKKPERSPVDLAPVLRKLLPTAKAVVLILLLELVVDAGPRGTARAPNNLFEGYIKHICFSSCF